MKLFRILVLSATCSLCRPLYADSNITVESRSDKQSFEITISGVTPSKATIFEVADPDRLVIDIPSTKQISNKSKIDTNKFIKKLRIGKHPDKTRVVIDLNDPKPQYDKVEGKDTLSIQFGSMQLSEKPKVREETIPVKKEDPVPVVKTEYPTSTPKAHASIITAPLNTVAPRPTATTPPLTPTPEPEEQIVLTPTSVPNNSTPTPAAESTEEKVIEKDVSVKKENTVPKEEAVEDEIEGQKITGIHFKKDSEGPLTEISLIERSEFSLSKVKNRRFKLTIPRCVAGSKGLLLPHFPPNDIAGFTLIQVMPGVDSVDVFIGVDDGMKVTAASIGSAIVLRPVPAGF